MNEIQKSLGKYMCYLLRHNPSAAGLKMDTHGRVNFDSFIEGINNYSNYRVTKEDIFNIINSDNKGRYDYDKDTNTIACCQGHSIEWVDLILDEKEPPEILYHGTTYAGVKNIIKSGHIDKMNRHDVHMYDDYNTSQNFTVQRNRMCPMIISIMSRCMSDNGYKFKVSKNGVWLCEDIPAKYIKDCYILSIDTLPKDFDYDMILDSMNVRVKMNREYNHEKDAVSLGGFSIHGKKFDFNLVSGKVVDNSNNTIVDYSLSKFDNSHINSGILGEILISDIQYDFDEFNISSESSDIDVEILSISMKFYSSKYDRYFIVPKYTLNNMIPHINEIKRFIV